ncbi:GyrI-like domain-containing protein [Mangrovimonas sp. TPBH4]|uniref:GyrI-like domain-containing protein n=1 Tax=Mangrovimonas sp. TPBH4 TaxID=1645914 RepID=UPI0006B5E8A5|nr:GyrI-like domain-containing protein [Mangrovimonas sp. TPBH4]
MKHEWRKSEKSIYLPKTKPMVIDVPEFQYIVLKGEGNPNNELFSKYIEALYSVSYAIKMTLKKVEKPPKGYSDWTVYPLTGIWDITENAKKNYTGKLNKDDLVFDLMIRQPDFVTKDFFHNMLEFTKSKKPNVLLDQMELKNIKDGKCIQMLHIGSYDDEPESFRKMEEYAAGINLKRKDKTHREIYLSDFRKVPSDKLKTLLRFQVLDE